MEKNVVKNIEQLALTLRNLRKAPNRKFLRKTLVDKLVKARNLYEANLYLLDEFECSNQKILLRKSRDIFSEIKIFIDVRLDKAKHLIRFKTIVKLIIIVEKLYRNNKMTTPKVDLKLGTAVVQVYDGSQEGLSPFIDSVGLFVDTVKAEFVTATAAQKTAADVTVKKFVMTRLIGKARSAVGENPADLDEILNHLKNRCGLATSSDVYVSKLGALKQSGDVNKFTTEVENLTFLLEKAYITEQIPVDVANKMAIKQGVKALSTGVRNPDTRLILKAGQFATLSAAIEKTLSNEATTATPNTNAIMFASRRGHNNRGRNNFNNSLRTTPQRLSWRQRRIP